MNGFTQTARTRVEGSDEVAYFAHPFEFDLYYKCDDERDQGIKKYIYINFKYYNIKNKISLFLKRRDYQNAENFVRSCFV